MLKNTLLVLLAVQAARLSSFGQGLSTLSGTVGDSESRDRLVSANVRVAGTTRGTITNADGQFKLTIERGECMLIFSSLGYQPESLKLSLTSDTSVFIDLVPSPIRIAEVLVLGEDPAVEIIRKAIARKREWMEKIRSYRFEAFTRDVLKKDTAIASITESYSTGTWTRGDTLREIVRQKRQTKNIPLPENTSSVYKIVNFNDDEIELFGVFVGPTAPDALDHYEYTLLQTRRVARTDIYEIRMRPKSRLRPLFDGTISIADRTFAVMGVDVKPNETFAFPLIQDLDLRYRQAFQLYLDSFWMPTDIRVDAAFTMGVVGISLPPITLESVSSIYDYAINTPVPDSLKSRPVYSEDSTATKLDTAFWRRTEVLPLTAEQQAAYAALDSSQTLEKQFQPGGPVAFMAEMAGEAGANNADIRLNRVEGLFLGAAVRFDSLAPLTSVRGSAGYGFSSKDVPWGVGATLYASKERILGVGADWYRSVDHVPDRGFYAPVTMALMSLFDNNDYRDYFRASGWRAFVSSRPAQGSWSFSFVSERHTSLPTLLDHGLFSSGRRFRPNPPVREGTLRSIQVSVAAGGRAVPLGTGCRKGMELSGEYSHPSIAASEFDFARYEGSIEWYIRTIGRSLFFPPTLRCVLSGGTSLGDLPPQRLFVLESRATGCAPYGVLRGSGIREFAGDRYVMLSVEHNFRSLPFLALNLPFLYRNGIELLVHASAAQAWMGAVSSTGGWYTEAGIGINRILGLGRFDVTYRFAHPSTFAPSFAAAWII